MENFIFCAGLPLTTFSMNERIRRKLQIWLTSMKEILFCVHVLCNVNSNDAIGVKTNTTFCKSLRWLHFSIEQWEIFIQMLTSGHITRQIFPLLWDDLFCKRTMEIFTSVLTSGYNTTQLFPLHFVKEKIVTSGQIT